MPFASILVKLVKNKYTPESWKSSKLANDPCQYQTLHDHEVYEGLKKGKFTCSVPGDVPVKILGEFLPEITVPVASIFREATATHTWPAPYKKEYNFPINKIPIPKSEDDLRNLRLTPFLVHFFSKLSSSCSSSQI